MKMQLVIGGRSLGLNQLGNPLDNAFITLHSAYFGSQALDWQTFSAAPQQFFDANPSPAAHDEYFNNFTIIWREFLGTRRYAEAQYIWEMALEPARQWEQAHPGQRLHKGTPFYFWGMTVGVKVDLVIVNRRWLGVIDMMKAPNRGRSSINVLLVPDPDFSDAELEPPMPTDPSWRRAWYSKVLRILQESGVVGGS